jgi:hypothetical protein
VGRLRYATLSRLRFATAARWARMLQRREQNGRNLSHWFRSWMPRRRVAFTGVFELWTTPACTDSAPPGLATSRAAGPDEPGQSPTRLVSGYALRLGVLPNTAIPPCPARGPQPLGYRLLSSTAQRRTWIFRSGLSFDKQKTCLNHWKKTSAFKRPTFAAAGAPVQMYS